MSAHLTPTLYIRMRRKVTLPKGSPIYLGQVAQFLIDSPWEERLKQQLLHQPSELDGNLLLIDMLTIIPRLKQLIPDLQIELLSEPHVLVEFIKPARRPRKFLLVMVCSLLFVGSGLAIMNFHADVSMLEVHQKIYTLVTGQFVEHPLLLQIPYSFGIGAGMMVFFNRVFRRKFNEEPNPLELEMFKYQESLNTYAVVDEYEKMYKKSDSH